MPYPDCAVAVEIASVQFLQEHKGLEIFKQVLGSWMYSSLPATCGRGHIAPPGKSATSAGLVNPFIPHWCPGSGGPNDIKFSGTLNDISSRRNLSLPLPQPVARTLNLAKPQVAGLAEKPTLVSPANISHFCVCRHSRMVACLMFPDNGVYGKTNGNQSGAHIIPLLSLEFGGGD